MEVVAFSANNGEPRFQQCEEMTAPSCGSRAASAWPPSPAASARPTSSTYRVVGTKGELVMDPAYEYAEELTQTRDGQRPDSRADLPQARPVRARADQLLGMHPQRCRAGAIRMGGSRGCPGDSRALPIG